MDMFRLGFWDVAVPILIIVGFLGVGSYLLYLIVRALRKYTSKEKDK